MNDTTLSQQLQSSLETIKQRISSYEGDRQIACNIAEQGTVQGLEMSGLVVLSVETVLELLGGQTNG